MYGMWVTMFKARVSKSSAELKKKRWEMNFNYRINLNLNAYQHTL